jgi:hypothetical protein
MNSFPRLALTTFSHGALSQMLLAEAAPIKKKAEARSIIAHLPILTTSSNNAVMHLFKNCLSQTSGDTPAAEPWCITIK